MYYFHISTLNENISINIFTFISLTTTWINPISLGTSKWHFYYMLFLILFYMLRASLVAQTEDTSLIPGSERFPGEGNGNPLQCSCLDNFVGRGAWQATAHGVVKSRAWLSDYDFQTSIFSYTLNMISFSLSVIRNLIYLHKTFLPSSFWASLSLSPIIYNLLLIWMLIKIYLLFHQYISYFIQLLHWKKNWRSSLYIYIYIAFNEYLLYLLITI